MIYFKKVYFNNDDKAKIETAIRKTAIKRNNFVQLEMAVSDIGTDKIFFGYENNKALYFTRIRTSFERLLPKIIFYLPKNDTDFYYQFRLGIVALLLFLLYCFAMIFDLLLVIKGDIPFENFATVLILFLVFLFLIWIEVKINLSKITKASMKQQEIIG